MKWPNAVFAISAWPYDLLTTNRAWWDHCRELTRLFPQVDGRRVVVDLGCGPGASALSFARACPDDRVIGMDLMGPMIRRARGRDVDRHCHWVQGNALALPFASASADVITGHSFLYLLPDARRALQEIRRVLKPQGRLVLMEPQPTRGRAARRALGAARRAGGVKFAFSMFMWRWAARSSGAPARRDLSELIESEGFETPEITDTLHGLGYVACARPRP